MPTLSSEIAPEELGGRLARSLKALRHWTASSWNNLQPGPDARRGALIGLLLTIAWAAIIGGINLKSGFGYLPDFIFALAIALVGVPLTALLGALMLKFLSILPPVTSGFVLASICFLGLLWNDPPVGLSFGAVLVLVEGSLGASLGILVSRRPHHVSLTKRVTAVAVCLSALTMNVLLFRFLHYEGVDERLIDIQAKNSVPTQLNAENPAEPGPFPVHNLIYGTGTDIRRPEFGKTVSIKTGTVNAAAFFRDFKGWKAKLRTLYWGFGMDKLPLNGRVWYPEGQGPFPLVLMVHGNHNMAEFSDPGYAYLGELFASRGFVFVSVDENFLNVGLFHDPPKQQAVRGWLLLEHLKLWHKWNQSKGNPFLGKIDLENVALMGHSRGGEAAATAALFNKLRYFPEDANIRFDYGFPIKAIAALAPVDGQYKPAGQWRVIEDVNYFTIQGSNDADLSSFLGSRQWEHVHFSGQGSFFKGELYVYRANHGQFNTVWGRTDSGAPGNWLLNLHPLLQGEDQRRIAKVYLSAFLEATLHGHREYVALFADHHRIQKWLPNTLYLSRYSDSTYRDLADFNEDADLTSTTAPGGHITGHALTLWHEGRIPYRQGDRDHNGVFLGWRSKHVKASIRRASYQIDLPASYAANQQLGVGSTLCISVAVTDEEPGENNPKDAHDERKANQAERASEITDFTVELITADAHSASLPISRFGPLLPPLNVKFTKLGYLDKIRYKSESEPVFQTVTLPLAAFKEVNPDFDPARLQSVRLRFDRTPERVIIINHIGFEESGGPVAHRQPQSAKIGKAALR